MEILKTVQELKNYLKDKNSSIGFVPTMGALHNGHASLISKSVEQNDITIVSTFVNPTQFLPNEDLDKYPKNEENDIALCQSLNVDAIFIPSIDEIYFENEFKISAPENLASILEGATRPGHFDGVCMVLNKLFNIIEPTRAYFGKKDTQQLIIVQNLVKKLFKDIQIIPCDIVREADGLALSSRNVYLDENEKLLALKISRSLCKAKSLISDGLYDIKMIKQDMLSILEPLNVDYVAFTDRNLNEISKIEPENSIILIAAFVGKTRLIDNMWI